MFRFHSNPTRVPPILAAGLVCLACAGCGTIDPPSDGREPSGPARVAGRWVLLGNDYWKGSTMELTPAGGIQIALLGKYSKEPEDKFGKYTISGDRFAAGPKPWSWSRYRIEFLGGNEIILTAAGSLDGNYGFEQLVGRWQRMGSAREDPVEEAARRVRSMTDNLARMEALLKSAVEDRKAVVTKLRRLGVSTAADIKSDSRSRQMAEDLARLTAEIDSLEYRVTTAESELLRAKSLLRRLGQEKATLSEDEKLSMLTRLREAEARLNSGFRPETPAEVEYSVERALKMLR